MQALGAGRGGGEYGVQCYTARQECMAVLADEIFLNLNGPGRSAWKADRLETRLFGSYNAGDQFFKRLQNLLETGDQVRSELAIVYLLALSLQFGGFAVLLSVGFTVPGILIAAASEVARRALLATRELLGD